MVALLALYLSGWRRLHRRDPMRWTAVRAGCFVAGMAALAVALWSPLEERGQMLLSWHMTQHMLLSMVAPPLLLMGWPFMPLMHGLPRWIAVGLLGPLLAWSGLRGLLARLVHPKVAWPVSVAVTWAWHVPAAYEWALSGPVPHGIEHACFLWSGMLFWWPVVEPWPWRGPWPRWSMAFYLLLADVANTFVAAILAFAPSVIYGTYALTAPALGVDPLADQRLAAAIMWLPGQLLLLVPAVVILARAGRRRPASRVMRLPVLAPKPPPRLDLLRVPLVGAVLRSRHGRLMIRLVMLAIATLVMLDGFLGPTAASTNLAGTWPWTHGRGLAVVAAIGLGNLACMGCPLIAPRSLLRQWIRPRFRWPGWLRVKWLVAALVATWLVAYEALGWWDSPWLTASLLLGLIALATAVDLLFEGASFCQWVCPVGQWNMAMAIGAPLQIQARDPTVCLHCTSQACLRGGDRGPGCGTGLFVPRKSGSLECTWCLDCVTACPHDNVAIGTVVPMQEITIESTRSAIGAWRHRADFATLLLILGAGGLANALLMTEPVVAWVDAWTWVAQPAARAAIATLVVIMLLLALPAMAAGLGGDWRERWSGLAMDLWPLGASVWLVHFGFHLVSGWASALPPLQRAAREGAGLDLGDPQWSAHCCAVAPQWLVPAMLVTLGLGLVATLWFAWSRASRRGRPAVVTADALVAMAWWMVAAWLVLQPMQMRGLLG
jgi:cytochrome c oxidase assembly factor CtaG/polyferredoxin